MGEVQKLNDKLNKSVSRIADTHMETYRVKIAECEADEAWLSKKLDDVRTKKIALINAMGSFEDMMKELMT